MSICTGQVAQMETSTQILVKAAPSPSISLTPSTALHFEDRR
jgi:hypothetical protein